jgi:hypothetical protein
MKIGKKFIFYERSPHQGLSDTDGAGKVFSIFLVT